MSGPDEQTLLELNLSRETWCQVEVSPSQSWDRAQRRHYGTHLKTSPVLLTALSDGPQRWKGCSDKPPVKLVQRRHFEDSCKTKLLCVR